MPKPKPTRLVRSKIIRKWAGTDQLVDNSVFVPPLDANVVRQRLSYEGEGVEMEVDDAKSKGDRSKQETAFLRKVKGHMQARGVNATLSKND